MSEWQPMHTAPRDDLGDAVMDARKTEYHRGIDAAAELCEECARRWYAAKRTDFGSAAEILAVVLRGLANVDARESGAEGRSAPPIRPASAETDATDDGGKPSPLSRT